ncbi:hypothetical protein DFP94_11081 [Fontibacillus phaseoli]|uniref:Uncharacterized protein n=2 Tax=Fontibacillus phaseoli TaxID=1416533 RepID=A0A369B685_9BACL|nr:hypothetical protein DFP94_11081 [Fontibacillus phaseoli]
MKRIVFIVVLALIAGSWGGNLWVYYNSQLPEPVFFKHYIEVENSPGYSFDLNYLENKSAKVKIQSIRIPELPNATVTPILVQNSYVHQNQGTMRTQIMDYDLLQPTFPEDGPLVIHRVEAVFDDNSTKELEIGEIRVYNDLLKGDSPIQSTSGGSSSENAGYTRVKFTKDTVITEISSAYLPGLGDRLTVILEAPSIKHLEQSEIQFGSETTHSGVPLSQIPFPLKFKKGDTASVTYKFDPLQNADAMAKSEVYRFLLRMELQLDNGKKAAYPIFVQSDPYLSQREVAAIVKSRRSGS